MKSPVPKRLRQRQLIDQRAKLQHHLHTMDASDAQRKRSGGLIITVFIVLAGLMAVHALYVDYYQQQQPDQLRSVLTVNS